MHEVVTWALLPRSVLPRAIIKKIERTECIVAKNERNVIHQNQKRSQAIAKVMKYYDDYSVENNAKLAKIVAYEKILTASWEVNIDEV